MRRIGIATVLLICALARSASAQQAPPFQTLDANTGAAVSPKVYVGLFSASASGATAVELPTALSSGGFKVACVTGCSGGTTDTDDGSIAGSQSTGINLGLNYLWNGANWVRLIGDATNGLTVQCAAGCTPGGSFADNSAFTFGTTSISVTGFVFDDVATNAATENRAATPRMSSNRVAYSLLRDAAGNERGANVTAGNALVVDGSASTQPVSGTVTVTDGAGAMNVICDSGCSGGTTDADDASIATGQTTGLNLGLTQVYDGSVWRRLTIGTAGTASAQVLTVQGIASATPVIVGDGAGALNVIVDSGAVTADTELPAAAALSDTTGNPTAPMVGSGLMVWDGSANWIRAKGDSNGLSVQGAQSHDGANVQNTKPVAIGCRASAAVPSDVSADNDAVIGWCLRSGAFAVQPTFGGVLGVAGNGVSGTGVQRVTIASDSTGVVGLATGSNTIGALTANQSVNVAQINGVTPLMGAGNTGTGSPRVTIATDQAAVVGFGVYTEDAGETAGGNLSMAGTVRRDAAAASAGTTGDNATLNTDANGLTWTRQMDPCSAVTKTYFPVNIVTATTTVVAAASASNYYYICAMNLFSAGTQNVTLVEDATGSCASPDAGIFGGTTTGTGYNLTAQTGIAQGNGQGSIGRTASTNVNICLITSAAVQLSGAIAVVAAP